MRKTRNRIVAFAGIGVAALVIAACGSSSSGTSSSSTAGSKAAPNTLSAQSTALGKILTTDGRTLYLFDKDKGALSTCSGACASNWPPFTADKKPAVSGGASGADITLVKRSDGKKQVDYKGHPLYFYAGDSSTGQTNGQGLNFFGAKWWVVSPAGSKITATASSSSPSGY